MEAVSIWVAVGVFAFIAGGEPDVAVQAAPDSFKDEAACMERQALVRERAAAVAPEGVRLVGIGTKCVEVKVERIKASPVIEFTPDQKSGKAKGSV